MNNSLKGALLSGLVFPGLGQIILKHYQRGVALMVTVLVSFLVIIVKILQQAFNILEKIDLEDGLIDINTISSVGNQASTTSDNFIFNFVTALITICWILGVIDAYRIGKKKDKEEHLTSYFK
jgi:cbb3-type cytochrome oxidase subunit 3